MSLVDKVANGAKKGIDWFTFADSIPVYRRQQVIAEECMDWRLRMSVYFDETITASTCLVIPTAIHAGAIYHYFLNSPQSIVYNTYGYMMAGIVAEIVRVTLREETFSKTTAKFEQKVARALGEECRTDEHLIASVNGRFTNSKY